MASSLALENQAVTDYVKLCEGFEGLDVEALKMNDDILKSLLEEDSPGDDQEYDRLNEVIRSLEAEIHRGTTDGLNLGSKTISCSTYDGEGLADNVRGRAGSHDWSELSDDFSWIDLDTVPSSLVEGMNWCMEEFGEEMNYAAEFEHADQRVLYTYREEATHSTLWHELNDEMMA